jgi:hypothetical protein
MKISRRIQRRVNRRKRLMQRTIIRTNEGRRRRKVNREGRERLQGPTDKGNKQEN